ncbi:Ribosome biogenesis protein ERB1 [Frankliniella fusca]|uniref:Ribosome biogenesis protein ERB1 n=1 Tax=Frankliniella fusca TaxID=407009 RepID=A0AAE1LHY3_9NEOP|nr:Ribosome biogenesis protein ERB1 [Frankliniella fusca]
MLEQQHNFQLPGGWCSDCRAAAARPCWDEHAVLNAKAAVRYLSTEQVPAGALQEAAALLQDVLSQESGPAGGDPPPAAAPAAPPPAAVDLPSAGRGRRLAGLAAAVAARPGALLSSAPPRPHPPPARARPPPPTVVDLDPPAPAAPAPHSTELNVWSLVWHAPDRDDMVIDVWKADALRRAPGVLRLCQVHCLSDPAWTLGLLQCAAPTVERLSVYNPLESHFRVVVAMPRLRRLCLWCDDDAQYACPPGLAAQRPPGSGDGDGLRWLRVRYLPPATLQALLQVHRRTLEELMLSARTPGPGRDDLHKLLGRCQLRALRRLVLRRDYGHDDGDCAGQRAAVRAVLPGVQVLCSICDCLEGEEGQP